MPSPALPSTPAHADADNDASAYADTVVVLVTHNRPLLLQEALGALAAQTRPARRVVVVDNASDAATGAVLGRHVQDGSSVASNGIEVVRSEHNLGGAGGFALGIERALALGAEWIWVMDDDAIPEPDALEALHRGRRALPPSAGVVCSCVMEFGAIATLHRRRFDAAFGFERAVAAGRYGAAALEIDTASFVGFMVSARAVAAAGLPDAAFFLSYDDTEYSLRLRRRGFGVWLVPASVVVHKRGRGGRLRSTVFGAKHYFNVRNRIVVKRRYCRFGWFGAALGTCFGIALWLRSPGRFARPPVAALLQALRDGYAARLGPYRMPPSPSLLPLMPHGPG